MEIERSKIINGEKAFVFSSWEKELIALKLKPEIAKRKNQIEKIENHPKNEGQCTYLDKIDALRDEIKTINAIIEGMTYSQQY